MENKSRFGLAAGLMGALVYLIGGNNALALVVLFIAIALWEENEFVKVCVKRVATLYLAYVVLKTIISVISSTVGVFGGYWAFLGKISSIIGIAYDVIIILLALKSLISPTVTESILDSKGVDAVTNMVSNVAAKVPTKEEKVCDKCGKTVDAKATFCVHCGNKFE